VSYDVQSDLSLAHTADDHGANRSGAVGRQHRAHRSSGDTDRLLTLQVRKCFALTAGGGSSFEIGRIKPEAQRAERRDRGDEVVGEGAAPPPQRGPGRSPEKMLVLV